VTTSVARITAVAQKSGAQQGLLQRRDHQQDLGTLSVIPIKSLLAAALFLNAMPSSAVLLTADYSSLGTVYQDGSGQLFNSAGVGRTDVTDIFKANVTTAMTYWDNAVLLPWNQTISFKLFDLTASSAVGDSHIDTFDANNRPHTSTIRVDDGSVAFFIDPTPQDNAEFAIASTTAALGGGTVNIGRFGAATSSPADSGYDLLSLLLHEMEHSLGFSSGTTRWDNVINAAGDTLTVPTSVSGLPSSYDIPINGTHIDGVAQNGLFNNTSIALPGFNSGERALLTGVDIQAICTIEGCAPDQMNTNPSAFALTVPEPGTLPLVGLAIAGLGFMGTYRRRGASQGGYCRDAEDRK